MKISTLSLFVTAVVLLSAAPSTLAQEICGGLAGYPCHDGQFCLLPDGGCCCDYFGVCIDIPLDCPEVCDPVCGCNGVTYRNRCEASAASVSVDHAGSCEPGEATITLRSFTSLEQLSWVPLPEVPAYNVYVRDFFWGPEFYGRCLYHTVPQSEVYLHGPPLRHQSWAFQVTAVVPEKGEGPMGVGSDCRPRVPIAPCTCTLLPEVGPCTAVVPRWYHDFNTGQCEEFTWGGCGGNANNFETRDECAAECMDPCTQPAVPGDCQAALPRWYYSSLSGHCEVFVWGGCGGNDNNFSTRDTCQAACGDICFLPPDPGDCDGICPRWYFDPGTGECEEFVWGCCGGNRNSFTTREDCEFVCSVGESEMPSSGIAAPGVVDAP
jgi:hypothetical protein